MNRCPRHPTGLHEWRPGPAVVLLKEVDPTDGGDVYRNTRVVLTCKCGAIVVRQVPEKADVIQAAI